ncbi:MAG: glycosyl hydrolase family 28 protein [Bacteroidota bacterium]
MKSFLFILLHCISFTAFATEIDILNYGAKADGKTMNTRAIQAAIDKCSKTGGTVIIPDGTFLTGTLYLKSNVTIHLTDNATILGSGKFIDYPNNIRKSNPNEPGATNKALFFANEASNITLEGNGTINGNGLSPAFMLRDASNSKLSAMRPMLIEMFDCYNVTVANLNLKHSALWMENYAGCVNVRITGIKVYNHGNFNNDGVDIDSKDVLIENCSFDCDDDGICLKSISKEKICENVIVRNCSVRTSCNAIKFGTGSIGGFRNINISNIDIKQASEDNLRNWQKNLKFIEQPLTVLSGIAVENVDGGFTDNVTISNIFMEDVQTPILVRLGNRKGGNPGHLRNINISNVTAVSHSKMTSSITGIPGFDAENIILSNIKINSMGDGTLEEANLPTPESIGSYPENRMFGYTLPSSGLFLRHVKGITLQNIQLETRKNDMRPAIIMEDVKGAELTGLTTIEPSINSAIVKLLNCENILLSNPLIKTDSIPYLIIEGGKTKAITVFGLNKKNDLIQLVGIIKHEVSLN